MKKLKIYYYALSTIMQQLEEIEEQLKALPNNKYTKARYKNKKAEYDFLHNKIIELEREEK